MSVFPSIIQRILRKEVLAVLLNPFSKDPRLLKQAKTLYLRGEKKMKTIFDTTNCYEGQSISEECWVIDSYHNLSSNKDIQEDTIAWSDTAYQDEKDYFMEFLQSLIKSYEKRYRTTVERIALVGRVGLWNGSPVGGRIIDIDDNPIEYMGNVDNVDVTVDEEGVITIHGHHHDGTHSMNIYLLTENKLQKVAPDYLRFGDYDYRDMERIYENLKPLKMGKVGIEYYGSYAS